MFPLGTILCEYTTTKKGKEVQWSQAKPVVWFISISDDSEGNYHIPLKFFESMVSMFSGSMVSKALIRRSRPKGQVDFQGLSG
jgi:hypothetical protein